MFELRREKNGRPLLIGHRGAMDVAPENTMPAFAAGLAGDADLLELDVQLTADEQVILFHDTDLQYKTGIRGQIGDFTAEFLQTLTWVITLTPNLPGCTCLFWLKYLPGPKTAWP